MNAEKNTKFNHARSKATYRIFFFLDIEKDTMFALRGAQLFLQHL